MRLYKSVALSVANNLLDESSFNEVIDALELVLVALKKRNLRAILRSPILSSEEKNIVLEKMVLALALPVLVASLLFYLTRNNALNQLSRVVCVLKTIRIQKFNVVDAFVTSATPLGDTEKDKIEKYFNRVLNRKIKLKSFVDPQILGGIVFCSEDWQCDASVRSQLWHLNKALS